MGIFPVLLYEALMSATAEAKKPADRSRELRGGSHLVIRRAGNPAAFFAGLKDMEKRLARQRPKAGAETAAQALAAVRSGA